MGDEVLSEAGEISNQHVADEMAQIVAFKINSYNNIKNIQR